VAGEKFLAQPYYSQRAVFLSPLSAFFIYNESVKIKYLKEASRRPQRRILEWIFTHDNGYVYQDLKQMAQNCSMVEMLVP